jgi:hypothetical protein
MIRPKDICYVGYAAKEACGNCAFYFAVPLSVPDGWCSKYPSKAVNCGDDYVCPLWENRKTYTGEKPDFSFLGGMNS